MAEFMKRSASALAAWWLRPTAPGAIPRGIHALVWLLLLGTNLLRLGVRWVIDDRAGWSWPLMLTDLALTVLTYAGLFYFTWKVVVPRHLDRQKPLRLLLVVLLAVTVTGLLRLTTNVALGLMPSVVPSKVDVAPHPDSASDSFLAGLRAGYREGYKSASAAEQAGRGTNRTSGKNIVPATLLVMLLGIYLRLGHDHQREQRRRQQAERQQQELERQHLAAELSLLKAQINPHFLFNTLNNIYSLATAHDVEAPAATAVLQLADLMRYLLYESATDTVPLHKEVTHLQNFLSLQLLRLPGAGPESLPFRVAPELAASSLPVAPMMLLPLVENAFKHGDLTARPHAVELELGLRGQELTFAVHNRRRAPRPGPAQPGGVGLSNLRRRLQLLYPTRYGLHVEETPDTYRATLTLLLTPAEAAFAPQPTAQLASA
ncbi:histidine kinase [Hymenobacter sp. 15J16-1T3B]|uniref:sensor histidine kinase n=1 Tax=Hymenobacter sp. 15J16-1T3B TaxID=2886941 RepID=UPI001D0FCA67|nr:histidine kinase [Hymenobacter sp. 15J16-1T3B]MCC3157925.1 histidine kinase [Hymenobacter sp. 15J16-1T3B]